MTCSKMVFNLFVFLAFSGSAFGDVIINRCKDTGQDNLTSELAALRTEWAMKCISPVERDRLRKIMEKVPNSYPTFWYFDSSQGEFTRSWLAPTDPKAPCEIPEDVFIFGYCIGGCYTPDQKVLFEDGYHEIGEAFASKRKNVMALTADSTLNALNLRVSTVDYYVRDIQPEMQPILHLKMKSGGELTVTPTHPLVDSAGRMRRASDLNVGEMLVTASGRWDPIEAIVPANYYGRVYNLQTIERDLNGQIIVGQGYLNGSLYFQNSELTTANAELLRERVPSSLLVGGVRD